MSNTDEILKAILQSQFAIEKAKKIELFESVSKVNSQEQKSILLALCLVSGIATDEIERQLNELEEKSGG